MLHRFRKYLNRLLKDKDDFPFDSELKRKVEIHNFMLENLIALEKEIVPAKLKYLWKNKKTFFLKLFIKVSLGIVVIGFVLFGARIFGFRYQPKEKQEIYKPITIYVTENTDTAYIRSRIDNPVVNFSLIFLPSSQKDWEAFKNELHSRFESPGTDSASYYARRWERDTAGRRFLSQYWGRYQLGNFARNAIGLGDVKWEDFASNPELQEGAFKTWVRLLYKELKPEIKKYNGKIMSGYHITCSGILAMAHNVGSGEVKKFLDSNGKYIPSDANDVAIRYLSLGNYDLSAILND